MVARKKDNNAWAATELVALWGDEYLATRTAEDLAAACNIALNMAEKILSEERLKRSEE